MSARRVTRTRLFAAALVGLVAVAIACSVESPTRGPDQRLTTAGPTAVSPNQRFFEFQVERQATPLPGNPAPRYPDGLRAARVEGEVLAQFVVGPDGRVDVSSFKVLRSSDPGFTEAVRLALPNFRFSPAMVGDRSVRQLVQSWL